MLEGLGAFCNRADFRIKWEGRSYGVVQRNKAASIKMMSSASPIAVFVMWLTMNLSSDRNVAST